VPAAETGGGTADGRTADTSARLLDPGGMFAPARRTARVAVSLGTEPARVALGRSTVEFPRGDRRFDDPAWREHLA
jgi:hypothetical protein